MKYHDVNYYLEVRDHRYKLHPTEKDILRKGDPLSFLRTQYQVQNEAQIRRNQKVIKNDNDQLIVKTILKINNQLSNNNKNLNYLIVLLVSKIIG